MIRNIIFDIGKVLVSYEPDAYMDRLGLDEKAKSAINQAMFQNKLWDESDQGLGTPEELLQKFIAGALSRIMQRICTIRRRISSHFCR